MVGTGDKLRVWRGAISEFRSIRARSAIPSPYHRSR